MNTETVRDRSRLWLALLIPAVIWVLALVYRGEPLAWDEVEYYRATRWIAEGQLPFRDYWEHHMPLQWFLFAPVAGVFGGGAGVDNVVALRWAQLILIAGIFALALRIARQEGIGLFARLGALALLLTAPSYMRVTVQYRIDVVGNLAFLAAFTLIASGRPSRMRFVAFGALTSAAVLANMRLAPLAMVAGLIALFWRSDERRWRPHLGALWMSAGIAAVAGAFVAYLAVTGSWQAFAQNVIWFNPAFDALVPEELGMFTTRLADPFLQRDPAGVAFCIAAIAGTVVSIRRRGPLQLAIILAGAALLTIAATAVHYAYHFHIVYILLIPVAAAGLELLRTKWRLVVPAIVLIALVVNASQLSFATMRYQDLVMREVDARTSPNETVLDGVAYALRRRSAYKYWFMPSAVRLMAQSGKIEPYDLPQLLAAPPAAVIHTVRIHNWFLTYPRVATYVVRHYVPLYRNLWLPGLTAAVGPEDRRAVWIVPKTGRYVVYGSTLLARHPWIINPIRYGFIDGSELEIPLTRLPLLPEGALDWRIGGVPVRGTSLTLKRGDRVELNYRGNEPAGVVVVPAGIDTLCSAPDGKFVF